MDHLNLPVIRGRVYREKRLPMDQYLRFVIDNLKYTVNIDEVRKLKKDLFVGKRFVLK